MFGSWLQSVRRIPEVAGVEILLQQDGTMQMRLVALSLHKNSIRKTHAEYRIDSFNDLKKKLGKDLPVALSISGKGIIHRRVTQEFSSQGSKINAVLSGAKSDEFYLQEFRGYQADFLTVARKDRVDKILEELARENIHVISVGLGPFALQQILPLIQVEAFTAGNYGLQIREKRIAGCDFHPYDSPANGNIELAGEPVDDRLLVAYANAFQAILEHDRAALSIESTEHNLAEAKEKQLFNKAGRAMLIVFLLLLLVNFGLFMHYSSATSNSYSAASLQKENRNIAQLRTELSEKEALVKKFGGMPVSGIAYMADRIAATVPEVINLTTLAVNPPDESKSRQERRQVFQNGVIGIAGNCPDIGSLNQWVIQLKQLPFCESVTATEYRYDERKGRGVFDITFNIH